MTAIEQIGNNVPLAFAFIVLTALDGSPVWVESSSVQIIRPAISQCHASVGAAIRIGTTSLCVRETPEEIRRKIYDIKSQ